MEEFVIWIEERIERRSTSTSHVDDVDSAMKENTELALYQLLEQFYLPYGSVWDIFYQLLGCGKVSSRWLPSNPSTIIVQDNSRMLYSGSYGWYSSAKSAIILMYSKSEAITVKEASFSWASDSDCVLKDIDLHVPVGKLIAVVGPVGSGKSSLLSALLGELYKRSGSVDLKGSIAYVPQVTWVLNRSLKSNILLVKHMAEEKYNKIVDLCCLRTDLEILPAGDETEIGEKGVNLSGGQKLRVNLAQAVYQDKDVYLLDDPLSAVDVHVRKSLFSDVIGNNGLLKKKTRILVTHDTTILPDVDLIVSMKDGKIDEMGSYNELLDKKGSFASFVEEHSTQKTTEESEVENEILSISRLNSRDSAKSELGDQLLLNAEKCADDEVEEKYRLTDDERMEIGGVRRFIYLNYVKKMGISLFVGSSIGFIAFVSFEAGGNIWLSKWSSDAAKNATSNSSQTIWRLSIYGTFGLAQ
ncbi:Multidrug resistance-associated protein 1, partial [Araneus ventricosus]